MPNPLRSHRAPLCAALLLAATPGHANAQAFLDEAAARGVSYQIPFRFGYEHAFGRGLAFADLNDDGAPDLITLGAADGAVGLFKNDGAGNFTNLAASSNIPLLPEASAVTAADYDADNDLDLFISCWCAPDRLLRNDGAFKFTDVTVDAGLDDDGAGAGSAWADVDGDGWLDLYLANRTGTDCAAGVVADNPNRLYVNQGDGTFAESAELWNVADADNRSFQPGFFDCDGDADPDLFVAEDKGPVDCASRHNKLFRHDGAFFTEISQAAGTDGCMNAMCVAVGDLDRDGFPDVYVTNTPEGNELYMNDTDATFTESAAAAGVTVNHTGWGAILLDHDNDGHLDLYVCNMDAPNALFDNPGAFPLAPNPAPGDAADPGQSFCVAAADIDDDGDLDLAVSTVDEPVRILVNQNPATDDWVKLRIVGRHPNLFAIGAVVRLRVGSTWWRRDLLAGSAYKSQDDLALHVGLGAAASIDELIVDWPDGSRRILTGLPTRTTHTVNPPCLADMDLDADTDVFDFGIFAAAFGAPADPGDPADLDDNGTVDVFDFAILAVDFGCIPD